MCTSSCDLSCAVTYLSYETTPSFNETLLQKEDHWCHDRRCLMLTPMNSLLEVTNPKMDQVVLCIINSSYTNYVSLTLFSFQTLKNY